MTHDEYPVHPAADLFPLLQGEELQELAYDIATNGQNEPVWMYVDSELGNVVLDGRNRIAACRLVDVIPKTQLYTGDDPIGFSISQNLKRRHLTTGQKAAIAVGAEPLYAAEAAKRKAHGQTAPGKTLEADRPQALKPEVDEPKPKEQPKKRAPQARDKAAKTAGTPDSSCDCKKGLVNPDCDHGIDRFRVRRVWPPPRTKFVIMTPEVYIDWLREIRLNHHAAEHQDWGAA